MKTKILKITLIFALLMLFTPLIANAASRGSCGSNLTWTLDDEGTLTISGNGAMTEYNYSSTIYRAPWEEMRSNIKTVVIGEGVTKISEEVFHDCSNLTTLYYNAKNCEKIGSIQFPAFENCSSLSTVIIGNKVESIPISAFSGCSGITDVYITDLSAWFNIDFAGTASNPLVDATNVYINGVLTKDLVIPDNVTNIKKYAFNYFKGFTSITIPVSVTSICAEAFLRNNSTIYYTGSYKDFSKIRIEDYNYGITGADIHCSDITLTADRWGKCGSSLAYFFNDNGTLTISGEGNMEDYSSSSSTPWYDAISEIKTLVLEEGIKSIDDYAFYGCSSLTTVYYNAKNCANIGSSIYSSQLSTVYIGDIVESIPANAFYNCKSLDSVYITDISSYLNIEFVNAYSNPMYYADKLYINNKRLAGAVKIPDGITKIPACAFDGCDGITSVTIPDSVITIGEYAFKGCNGLKNVYMSDLLTWCNIEFKDSYSNPMYYADNLYQNDELLTELIIPNGVTSIGAYTFSGCIGLTNVIIPNSVTDIASHAFWGCNGIKNVYISDLTTWCSIKFDNAYSNPMHYADNLYLNNELIADLVIPNNVVTIGAYAFSDCSGITSLTIPNSVTSIGDYAFSNCSGITSLTIPNSVTSIGNYAFSNCSGITSLTIPNSVTSIGDYAFSDCSEITGLTIPNSVTSIGNYAFHNCSEITSLTIPNSVTSIGCGAFKGFNALEDITIPFVGATAENSEISYKNVFGYIFGFSKYRSDETPNRDGTLQYTENGPHGIETRYYYNIPKALRKVTITADSIPYNAFLNCSNLESVSISNSAASIGNSAFYGCSGLKDVYISDLDYWCNIIFENLYSNPMCYADNLYANNELLTEFIIPEGVTTIGSYVFYDCDNLTSITIPDSVTTIADHAFSDCSGITSLAIPDSVTTIADYAFSNCSGITSLAIPDSVTTIGLGAFYGCDNLINLTVPFIGANKSGSGKDYTNVFGYIFGYHTSTNKNDREGIYQYYYDGTYYYYNIPKTLKNITIKAGNIPYQAFYNCSNLKTITISDDVTSIGERAFYGCNGLTTVNYNARNCTQMSRSIFSDCYALSTVNIGDGVEILPDYAFYDCSSLAEVTISDSVTSIGDYAFYRCSGMTSLTIPDSVTTIGDYAFYDCNDLLLVIIGNKVTNVEEGAFSNCSKLKKLFVPKSVAEIEREAFANCNALTIVEYGGSEADWNEMYIGSGNDCLRNATIHYNSTPDNAKLTDSDYLTYTINMDGTITIISCHEKATNINIPSEINGIPVTSINSSAFANKSNLTSVTIPNSITTIGERAFYGCSKLTSIVIPESVKTIESNTFYNCNRLENITIPDSITSIGDYAFYVCSKLTEVYYSGSEAQWNDINIDYYGNSALTNAKIYYNGELPPPPITITEAEVIKTENDTTWGFEVIVEQPYEDCYVYAATYDEDYRLIAISCVPLNMSGNTNIDVDKSDSDSYAKIFVWTDLMEPITYVKEVDL